MARRRRGKTQKSSSASGAGTSKKQTSTASGATEKKTPETESTKTTETVPKTTPPVEKVLVETVSSSSIHTSETSTSAESLPKEEHFDKKEEQNVEIKEESKKEKEEEPSVVQPEETVVTERVVLTMEDEAVEENLDSTSTPLTPSTTKTTTKPKEVTFEDDGERRLKEVFNTAKQDLQNAGFPGWMGAVFDPVRSKVLCPTLDVCSNVVPTVSSKIPFAPQVTATSLGIMCSVIKFGYGIVPHKEEEEVIVTFVKEAETTVEKEAIATTLPEQ